MISLSEATDILYFLSQSAFSAALTGLAFVGLAPTKLGEKFLNHHLERKLAALRHDQNQQIEELKTRLAHLGDRGIRANEREFQAIEAAWGYCVDAYAATMRCVLAYSQHPEFESLSDVEARQYLDASGLSEQQRQEIMSAPAKDRRRLAIRASEINQVYDAGLAIYNARSLIRKQAIFMPDNLLNSLETMMQKLSAAQIQRSMEPHYGASGLKDVEWLLTNGEKERGSLLAAMRERIIGK